MKLDKYAKQAIVKAIMNDVPKPDKQKRRAELQTAIVKLMSPEVRKVYKVKPSALRSYLVGDLIQDDRWEDRYIVAGDVSDKDIELLLKPYEAENGVRRDVEHKLRSIVDGCSTLNVLKKRLPEFEKYYPTEAQPTKNLPVVANVVADLSRLGWPKGEKK
jgi:hypothetical protein